MQEKNLRETLNKLKEKIKGISDSILQEMKRVKDANVLYRDLFIVMQRDFLYINGTYDHKLLTENYDEFKSFFKNFKIIQDKNGPLIEGFKHIVRSIIGTLLLRKDLNKFKLFYNLYKNKSYLNEDDLVNLDKELNKTVKISDDNPKDKITIGLLLQRFKSEIIFEIDFGIVNFLDFLWDIEDLANDNTHKALIKLKSLLKDNDIKEKKNDCCLSRNLYKCIALDVHEIIYFIICLMRDTLRLKYKRTIEEQEKQPNSTDILIFHLIDLMKLQPQDMHPVSNTNIIQLYSQIEYSPPIQLILVLSLIYFINTLNETHMDKSSAFKMFCDQFEQKKHFHSFQMKGSYNRHLWHQSILIKPLPLTYKEFVSIHNKLKIYSSSYCKKSLLSRRALNETSTQSNQLMKSSSNFYEFLCYFINFDYLIFQNLEKSNDKPEDTIFQIRKVLMSLDTYKLSVQNALLFSKLSLSNNMVEDKVLIDIYIKLVEFYEVIQLYKHKLHDYNEDDLRQNNHHHHHRGKHHKHKDKDPLGFIKPFSSTCQEMFQLIRDISIVVYKAVVFLISFLNDKHSIINNANVKLEKIKEYFDDQCVIDDDMKTIYTHVSSIIKLVAEAKAFFLNTFDFYGVSDSFQKADVELFLPADFQEIILTFTISFLELSMFIGDYDWMNDRPIKSIIYDFMRLIKILPVFNTYFRYFQNGYKTYFENFCNAYMQFTYEFGKDIIDYLEMYCNRLRIRNNSNVLNEEK